MHFLIRSCSSSFLCQCAAICLLGGVPVAARAAAPEAAFDAATLTDMEQHARVAEARERTYLYSELLHHWTELASREMAAGDDSNATKCLQNADADATFLKSALGTDSKRLKNAELLIEHTARRLTDMVKVASLEEHDSMQLVLKHLNSVHDAMLAQIFSH